MWKVYASPKDGSPQLRVSGLWHCETAADAIECAQDSAPLDVLDSLEDYVWTAESVQRPKASLLDQPTLARQRLARLGGA
jgi:hypothetical protein